MLDYDMYLACLRAKSPRDWKASVRHCLSSTLLFQFMKCAWTVILRLLAGSTCFEQVKNMRWTFILAELPRRARRAVDRFRQLQKAKPNSSARVSSVV
jgi:hypothetical protein